MPPEIGDFEAIPAVAAAAAARVGNELLFPFSKAFEIVRLCSKHQIAVLGIELFAPRTEGAYQAMGFSDYDLRLKNNPERAEEWLDYVKANNTQAEQFLTQNRDNHLIVFTTASWMEFREIRNKSNSRTTIALKTSDQSHALSGLSHPRSRTGFTVSSPAKRAAERRKIAAHGASRG
jgi:hypothetical protein